MLFRYLYEEAHQPEVTRDSPEVKQNLVYLTYCSQDEAYIQKELLGILVRKSWEKLQIFGLFWVILSRA